jgi:hypothetical protein
MSQCTPSTIIIKNKNKPKIINLLEENVEAKFYDQYWSGQGFFGQEHKSTGNKRRNIRGIASNLKLHTAREAPTEWRGNL